MGKNSKTIGILLLVLGVACIGMYFFMGDKFSNYKVTFDTDGGTIVPEQTIKKGEKATKPADPTKENNEFVEWQLNGIAYNFDSVVSNNITIKALWKEIIKYNVKVTLDGNDYTADFTEGENVTLEGLNIPVKEGYNVKFYKENSEEEYDISTQLTSDIVLKAEYVEIKTFTVKFNSNGGSKVEDAKVIDGKTVSEPSNVTKDGYVLDGWYLGEEKFNFTTPITKDITLKARWNDGEKINVIFTVDGATYKTVAVKENAKVSKPANPTKKGYKFVEWQLNGAAFDFNTKITEEITLTASFEESNAVTVTFDSDGGSSVKAQEVEVGGKATKPTDPTKTGYKFVEWQLNGKKYDFNTAVNDNIKLKATWVKAHTVKFVVDGKTISSQTIVDGEKVAKPANPTKEGYKFVSWLYSNKEFNFDTPITVNIELVASFEKNAVTPEPSTPTPTPDNQNTGDATTTEEPK